MTAVSFPADQPDEMVTDAPSLSPAVVMRDVHVTYTTYQSARLDLQTLLRHGPQHRKRREIHALRGVSLTVYRGETIGIVGVNGSGKSTMLRAVAGLLPATKGTIYARARPTLLGVGQVLRPSLSGRENILLGGLALGLTRQQVLGLMDEIIEFSGLEDFVDLPMSAYSSGMKARLRFSVATAVIPEILLIDEVLAVGDRRFKRRSWQRIREIRENAGTVFVVSHNAREVLRTCTRAVWLDKGEIIAEGSPQEVIQAYNKDSGDGESDAPDDD